MDVVKNMLGPDLTCFVCGRDLIKRKNKKYFDQSDFYCPDKDCDSHQG